MNADKNGVAMTSHITPLFSNTPSHRHGENNKGCHDSCHDLTYNTMVLMYTKQEHINSENNGL